MTKDSDTLNRVAKHNSYCDRFASDVSKRTENRDYTRAYQAFLSILPANGTILDIGCGTGIHLSYFSDMGRSVLGIEPSAGMRAIASSTGLPVIDGTFETIDVIALPEVSGIWCAAFLLHFPISQLDIVFGKLAKILGKP